MRRLLGEFSRFNRAERAGGAGLLLIAALLIGTCHVIRYTRMPQPPPADDAQLAASWQAFLAEHGITDSGKRWAHHWEDEGPPVPVVLAPFDPNTIDSMGIRRLGLSGRIARNWLRWRDEYHKKFYDAEDLKPMYGLAERDWARIAPYVRSSIQRPHRGSFGGSPYPHYDIPDIVDINTADTTLLDRAVRGIGPYLARRIIQRRDALGGYYRMDQVVEGLRIPDTTIAALTEKLRFVPEKVRRLSLNNASLEQLKGHPYIGEKMAANIVMFREALSRYDNIEQLKQVPMMTGENFRKIAPYFKVD